MLSTVGLAIGLAVGGFVLTVVLRAGLERASDDASAQSAREVDLLITTDRLPDPIPAGGTTLVQVVDPQGRVVAASAGADRLVPALPPDELSAALAGPVTVPGARFAVQGPVRVVALRADSPVPGTTVVVAAPAGDIDDAIRVARTALIGGFAVLLAVLAAVAWRLIGATLRPVEALRAGAEKITGTGSTDTLPLPNSADEIRRLAETLNGMLGRLASSRRRQRAFVADAAHELRSPLASLRTQLDVAIVTGDEPDPADLRAEVDRLTGLVDDLLVLARVDDAAPPPPEHLDLPELAIEVADRFAAARVPVTVTTTTTTPGVRANRTAVTRSLANVLDNAVRHAGTAVTVSVGPAAAGGAQVVIADDGPGIPAADRERVFERFARLHDARDRDTGGSGLGLAIVRELIGQQDGTVTLADAAPDADPPGLQVRVWLPTTGR
jgi:signal transduction histidine kinase